MYASRSSASAITASWLGRAAPFSWMAHSTLRATGCLKQGNVSCHYRNARSWTLWYTIRLCGTGSNDLVVRDLFVPEEHLQLSGPAADQTVRTALRVSVHVHRERTRYGTRNRPPRDRHADRDHCRKPARRYTLGGTLRRGLWDQSDRAGGICSSKLLKKSVALAR